MKVKESAETNDTCRNTVRIDSSSLILTGLSSGDIVIITNKMNGRKVAARCLDSMLLEADAVIRMDKVMRLNLGLEVGQIIDSKSIEKAETILNNHNSTTKVGNELRGCQINVKLESLSLSVPAAIDEEYIARSLQGIPLIKSQVVIIPYYGGLWFSYVVIDFETEMINTKISSGINVDPFLSVRSEPVVVIDKNTAIKLV
jgi:hypothetical protein